MDAHYKLTQPKVIVLGEDDIDILISGEHSELIVVDPDELAMPNLPRLSKEITPVQVESAAPPKASVAASGPFILIACLLPGRLYKEDVGDAMEVLAELERRGAPPWVRWLKILSAHFWLLENVFKEIVAVIQGKNSSSKS